MPTTFGGEPIKKTFT
ncbi:hypothetical protein [Staphylococcus aureus]